MTPSRREKPAQTFWLNGRFVGEKGAKISLLDRGLLFGDSLYEVVRFYKRRLFLLDRHIESLYREAASIAFPIRITEKEIAAAVEGLVAKSEKGDGLVLLHWTRGEGVRKLAPPEGLRGNIFAVSLPLPSISPKLRRAGVPVVTMPDRRWHDTDIKSTNLLANVLARAAAEGAGAHEAVLYRGRGEKARLTEGTSFSLFLVRRGRLITPAVRGLLPGITRGVVIEAAAGAGVPVEERTVRLGELREADEAFLTATSAEILPIAAVDGRPLRKTPPGPVTLRLREAFAAFRRGALRRTPPASRP